MRTFTIALVTTFIALSLAPLQITSAGTCVSDIDHMVLSNKCCSTNGTLPIVAPDGSTYYVDQRSDPKAGAVWIYEETNNVTGLQRGGIARATGEHDFWVNGKATPGVFIDPITINGVSTPASPYTPQVDINPITVGPVTIPLSQHVGPTSVPSQSTGPIVIPVTIHQNPVVTPSQHIADVNVYDGCFDVYPNVEADTNLI